MGAVIESIELLVLVIRDAIKLCNEEAERCIELAVDISIVHKKVFHSS